MRITAGFLFIEVPCCDFLYKHLHEPHLLSFDKPSLTILLNNCCFDVLAMSYAGRELDLPPEPLYKSLSFRIFRKLLRVFPSLKLLVPTIDSLDSIDTEDQKLLSLYHSSHVQSVHPSQWVRAIAVNTKK